MGRRRAAQCARPQADDLFSLWCIGRRADDVAARRTRRTTELGLPFLLDSRLEFHDRRAVAAWLLRRGAVTLLVVHAGDGAHGPDRRRAVSARRRSRRAG